MKIFDVRKIGCMQTYKGHATQVTAVRHSPDGRWIVSGDAHGVVKVWDLTSGRLIQEFKLPSRDRVVALDFHPNEFLLAVAGEHATSFWDMESFAMLSSTPKESASLRCARFSACGRALFAPSGDQLKTWTWEPEARMEDLMDVGWGSGGAGGGALASGQILCDIAEGQSGANELIGVTRMKTVLGIYVCDLSTLRPFDQPMDEHDDTDAHQSLMETMEPISLQSQQPVQPSMPTDLPSPAYAAPSLASPVRPSILDKPHQSFFDAHAAHANGVQVAVPTKPNPYVKPTLTDLASQPHQSQSHARISSSAQYQSSPTAVASTSFTPAPDAAGTNHADQSTSMSRRDPVSLQDAAGLPASMAGFQLSSQLPPAKFPAPTPVAATASTPAASSAPTIDLETHRRKVLDEHKVMLNILSSRSRSLQSLQTHWLASNPKRCVDELVKMNDLAVTVDFLSYTESAFTTGGVLTLDMARDLLPLCKALLTSKFESYATTGLKYIKIMLINFTPIIQSQQRDHGVMWSTLPLVCFAHLFPLLLSSLCQAAALLLSRPAWTSLARSVWLARTTASPTSRRSTTKPSRRSRRDSPHSVSSHAIRAHTSRSCSGRHRLRRDKAHAHTRATRLYDTGERQSLFNTDATE